MVDAEEFQALVEAGRWTRVAAVVRAIKGKRARAEAATEALHPAIEAGASGAVKALVAAGADVEAVNDEGHVALYAAASGGELAMVKALLAAGAGAEPEQSFAAGHEETPLHGAAKGGHVAVVNALLAAGADPNAGNWADEPVLQEMIKACKNPSVGIVKALVAAGADLDSPPPDHSIDTPGPALWTMIQVASKYQPGLEKNLHAFVKVLLTAGADPNQRGPDGTTGLHQAVLRDDAGLVRLLLQRGADPSAADEAGNTPASVARGSMATLLASHPRRRRSARKRR